MLEQYVGAKVCDATISAITSDCMNLARHLSMRFRDEYEILLGYNEEDRSINIGYRIKPRIFEPNLIREPSGFTRLLPKYDDITLPSSYDDLYLKSPEHEEEEESEEE